MPECTTGVGRSPLSAAPTSRTQLSFPVCFGTLQSSSVDCPTYSCTQEGQAVTYGERWVIPEGLAGTGMEVCEPEPHSYSALTKRTKCIGLKSLASQCKIKGAVRARSLSYLGRGPLRASKGPDSWITPQVCKDSSLRFDKGGSWRLEPKQTSFISPVISKKIAGQFQIFCPALLTLWSSISSWLQA